MLAYKFLFIGEFIISHNPLKINNSFKRINNWTIPHKPDERGIKWTIYFLWLKIKKACNFNHFRRKCISSDTKWLNIIRPKTSISRFRASISSNRRRIHFDEWWYTAQRADEIHAEAWWYAKPAVWIKKVVSKWYDFFGTDIHNETDCFRHYPYIFQTGLKPYVFK